MGVSMRVWSAVLGTLLGALLLSACAGPQRTAEGSSTTRLAFAPEPAAETPGMSPQLVMLRPERIPQIAGGLAGRTIRVSRIADIRLAPGEVVLTFDDGPMPGKTERVLDILDQFGVKATFLMVGQMARAWPAIARKVAARGHSVGSHTQNHPNLAAMGHAAALSEIEAGRRSIAAALAPLRPAPFFRFPYLASTGALRQHLAAQGIVVIDVDIDSKDYFSSGPDALRARTVSSIASHGSGVVLFHDIHARTAAMLPALLRDLKSRGYRVVHLAPGSPGTDVLLASVE